MDEAVLAVKVDVEASRFHAGVDDMSVAFKHCDEIKVYFLLPRDFGFMYSESQVPTNDDLRKRLFCHCSVTQTHRIIRGCRVQNQ